MHKVYLHYAAILNVTNILYCVHFILFCVGKIQFHIKKKIAKKFLQNI